MNILKSIYLWTKFLSIYRIKLGMLYDLSSQASTLIIDLNVLCWSYSRPIVIMTIKNHEGKI